MKLGRFFVVLLAVLLYSGSIALPAYISYEHESADNARVFDCRNVSVADMQTCINQRVTISTTPSSSTPGYFPLLIGWAGLFVGQVGWFANIFFLIALVFALTRKYKKGFVSAGIAFLLGLSALTLLTETLPADEGGVMVSQVLYFSWGYYLWLLSFAIIAGYCWKMYRKQPGQSVTN